MSSRSKVLGSRPPPGAPETSHRCQARVLCLGNELLADDALGRVVAERLRALALPGVEVEFSAETGFNLFDHILATRRLIVVDTILMGSFKPGSVLCFRETDVESAFGGSPHYIGLFEALAAARRMGLAAPEEVDIIAVEGADCTTVGGSMHPAVEQAVPDVIGRVNSLLQAGSPKT